MSTLTYNYADSTAVLGPLSRTSEPHSYDLCSEHSAGMTVPRGWRVIRVPGNAEVSDDLVALSDALHPPRHAPSEPRTRAADGPESPERSDGGSSPAAETGARRHLHVVRSPHA